MAYKERFPRKYLVFVFSQPLPFRFAPENWLGSGSASKNGLLFRNLCQRGFPRFVHRGRKEEGVAPFKKAV